MKSINRTHKGIAGRDSQGHYGGEGIQRRAVGYVRVSTDMQASEGMSLEAQQSAIEGYCALHGIRLVKICFGKVPFGKRTIPAPDHPRMKILVENEAEQRTIAQIKEWAKEGVGISEMAERLNAKGTRPPQGETWTKSLIYNLRLRLRHISPRAHNERPYTDSEIRERILELRANGHTARQIAAILNEQGWIPLKGRQFTERNVQGLLRSSDAARLLSPRRYLEMMLTRMKRAHEKESPGEPFEKPPLPTLGKMLEEAGYKTPRGHEHWWPAQVVQVMDRRFDGRYRTQNAEAEAFC